MAESTDIGFATVPVKALNISSRLCLSWYLNPEQPIRSKKGIARDYRGLAEQMDFQFNDIKNFQRSEDPTSKILEASEANSNITIGDLVTYLENMDRHDALQDLEPHFIKDGQAYFRRTEKFKVNPIQVAEVTSCRAQDFQYEDNSKNMTLSDVINEEIIYYDAYVCYADENSQFVCELAKFLESPEIGFKLCIRGRDLLAGHQSETDALIKLIQERCRRMLIILSPDFVNSPECEFQTSFAASLAIEQRKRKLIPVVMEPCELPTILKFVSKIDFTKQGIQAWLWDKLVMSICGNSAMFVSPTGRMLTQSRQQVPQLESSTANTSNPIITFPSTSYYPPLCSSAINSVAISTACTPSAIAIPDASLQERTVAESQPKSSKSKWYQNIRDRFVSHTNIASSSISSRTSGFHSQSGNELESLDGNTDFSSDTAM